MKYDELGRELPDPTRVEIPVGFQKPESIEEKIARAIYTHEWRKRMEDSGFETPEEADDFDVNDDVDLPTTQYELSAMQEDAAMERRVAASAPPPANPVASPPEPKAPAAGAGGPPPAGEQPPVRST